jgi:hypothetical protein
LSTLAALGLPVLRGTGTPVCIETCPDYGEKLRVIVCFEEPWLIRKILIQVQQPNDLADIGVRGPPGETG